MLYIKNKDAFEAKANLMRIAMMVEKKFKSEAEFVQLESYLALKKKYDTQQKMIFGEGTVFVLSLIVGIWLIVRSSKKELDASRQRKNFLLSITHELKSPLASIRLSFDTLIRHDLKREMVSTLSQNALKETERLSSLVDNLLLATRLESTYQPSLEALDFVDFVESNLLVIRQSHPGLQLNFESKVAKLILPVDRLGMVSVLTNLVENAIKYSKDLPEIQLTLSKLDRTLVFTVADKGIGISETDKKLVFDRFFRAGNEETRKTKGTGLGLYIVKQIIRGHQGQIVVTDNHPTGTVFTITLPLGLELSPL